MLYLRSESRSGPLTIAGLPRPITSKPGPLQAPAFLLGQYRVADERPLRDRLFLSALSTAHERFGSLPTPTARRRPACQGAEACLELRFLEVRDEVCNHAPVAYGPSVLSLRGRGALGRRRGISTVLDFVMLTVLSTSWALVLVCAMFHELRRW